MPVIELIKDVGVIAGVVVSIIAIITATTKLSTTVSRLDTTIQDLKETLTEFKCDTKSTFERIHQRIDNCEDQINAANQQLTKHDEAIELLKRKREKN
jgi:predicted RNase H-like nuclease (RuvC/YqgF family)